MPGAVRSAAGRATGGACAELVFRVPDRRAALWHPQRPGAAALTAGARGTYAITGAWINIIVAILTFLGWYGRKTRAHAIALGAVVC